MAFWGLLLPVLSRIRSTSTALAKTILAIKSSCTHWTGSVSLSPRCTGDVGYWGWSGKGLPSSLLALGAGRSQDLRKRDQFAEEQSWGQWGTLSTGRGVFSSIIR